MSQGEAGASSSQAGGSSAPFELGINYWPGRRAMYMWREPDLGEVRDDMSRIAELGFDAVRVFALMQDFLPRPDAVDHSSVDMLVDVARVAGDAGLSIVPTLIVLNMSGRIWWPEWLLDSRGRAADLFSEPAALRAQVLLADTCARALAGGASLRAFDIANEIDGALRPTSRDAGARWVALLADTIRASAPGTPVRIGAHLPSLNTHNNLRIDDLADLLDEDMMHAYPLYCETARSYLDPQLVPFSCALTAGLAARDRRPLMQEFGLCTAPRGAAGRTFTDDFLGQPRTQYLASEEEAALYYAAVLQGLVDSGAAGAYAWCYADYHPGLFTRPPLDTAVRERTFGLVRADGTCKPAAHVFREFRHRRDAGELMSGDVPAVLDISADSYYEAPAMHFDRLYAGWVEERP